MRAPVKARLISLDQNSRAYIFKTLSSKHPSSLHFLPKHIYGYPYYWLCLNHQVFCSKQIKELRIDWKRKPKKPENEAKASRKRTVTCKINIYPLSYIVLPPITSPFYRIAGNWDWSYYNSTSFSAQKVENIHKSKDSWTDSSLQGSWKLQKRLPNSSKRKSGWPLSKYGFP